MVDEHFAHWLVEMTRESDVRKLSGAICLASLMPAGIAFDAVAQQGPYPNSPNSPNSPIKVIIPFTPGSVAETEGRVHFARGGENLRQQFRFDLRD